MWRKRARAMKLARSNTDERRDTRAPVVFSLDDDAEFSSPTVVSDTLLDFDDPRIAVVAIACIGPRKGPEPVQPCPPDERVHITDRYFGTAHAVLRQPFFEVGGYREWLEHF